MVLNVYSDDYSLYVDADKLIQALIKKENPYGLPWLVGDKHLKNKAYGLLQIRLPYLNDVNRIAGKDVQKVWGKDKLEISDMNNKEKAIWAAKVYLSHYGKVYYRKTGEKPSYEVYARIHNGGPNGWNKDTTLNYGKSVVKIIEGK